jgi:phage shock protein A
MNYNETQEQLRAYIATLKLTERKYAELGSELSKWEKRAELARDSGQADLQSLAEAELLRLKAQQQKLADEIADYKGQIEKLRTELPLLAAQSAAQRRSVDPDLLEQELLIAGGYNPGEEEKAAADRIFAETEKKAFAEDALASLKKKMKSSAS